MITDPPSLRTRAEALWRALREANRHGVEFAPDALPPGLTLADLPLADWFPSATLGTADGTAVGTAAGDLRRARHDLRIAEIQLLLSQSDTRQAQHDLAASRARYVDLYELAPVGYCTVDTHGCMIRVNHTAATLLNRHRGALLHEPFVHLVHPADHDTLAAHFADVRENAAATPVDVRLRSRLDGWTWMHLMSAAGTEDDGSTVLRVTISDATARKHTEEALARTTALLERTGAMAQIGGWSLDAASGALTWSRETYRIFGVPAGGALTLDDAMAHFSDTDQTRIRTAVFEGLAERTAVDLVLQVIDAAGRPRWIAAHGTPVERDGEVVGLTGTVQDITDRRAEDDARRDSEFRWTFAIEGAGDGLWDWDVPAGRIFYSPRCYALLGATPDSLPPTPGGWQDRVHPEDAAATAAALATLCDGATTSIQTEHRLRSDDGRYIWCHARGSVVSRDAAGQPLRIIGTQRNIEERVTAEAAHAQMETQLREAQKLQAMGTLAGGIAHDFNNIIAAVMGYAELARLDTQDNPRATESLNEVHRAAGRARDLVRQILAFSRQERTPRSHVRLDAVLNETAHLLQATLPARVTLTTHCAAGTPSVLADETHLQQILVNLATNALHAIHDDAGHIDLLVDTVPLTAQLAASHPTLAAMNSRRGARVPLVRIRVCDNGSGMDAATVSRIFDPFFTTKPSHEGTGIGLAVVHTIVDALEGAILVESALGRGTTFSVYLAPASRDTAPVAAPEEVASPATTWAPGHGPRLLYIDDYPVQVQVVMRLLGRRGYRVTGFTNATDAVAAVRIHPNDFDLVLTDYNMPQMSGLDVARAVRAIRPELPVAVTSGYIDDRLRREATDAGVRAILTKASEADPYHGVLSELWKEARAAREAIGDSPAAGAAEPKPAAPA